MDNRIPTPTQDVELDILDVLARMYFIRPGIVEAFYPDTNMVDATSAIMKKRVDGDTIEYVKHPMVMKVPVVMPYSPSAGLSLTFPIKAGDPCLLMFSDRFIDEFVKTGTHAAPEASGPDNRLTEPRMHHITDAICLPGFISQKHVIPQWNVGTIEMRNADRSMYVSLGPEGIRATDGQAVFTMSGGKVRFEAPAGFYVNAPNVVINDQTGNANFTGVISAQNVETNAGFDANGHRHSGVQSGGSNTGTFV